MLRYLKEISDFGIIYAWHENNFFSVYTNFNYNERILFNGKDPQISKEERKVISGWGIFLKGGLISWSSKRQYYVTTLTIETEYIGQVNIIKLIILISQFVHELRLPIIRLFIILWGDNSAAISLVYKPFIRVRLGYIDTVLYF